MRRGESDTLRPDASYGCTIKDEEIILRIETFDASNGGGVGWYEDNGVYHLYLLATGAPIARLMPACPRDEVTLGYWSHRRKWEDIDDMGGCALPTIRPSTTLLKTAYSGLEPNQKRTKTA
jgi:hypothetical protein